MGFALSDMVLTSPVFESLGPIPTRHTGEGVDVSPPLQWRNAPDGTAGYAILCHDPDAPLVAPEGAYGFVHWALYNIPASVAHIDEGTHAFTAGRNDMGRTGYGGPMPPQGHGVHHYYFWLLALDTATDLQPGLTMWQLLERLEPHVLAMNRLIGTYERA